jgi:outer membrane protein assembly factor BamB
MKMMRKIAFSTIALTLLLTLGMMAKITYALYPTTDPWPVWRFDQAHQAYATSAAPTSNKTIWATAQPPATPYYPQNTPIVAEGMVIFCGSNKIYALDEVSGVELWRTGFSITGGLGYANPAYHDGRVFVTTYSGYLYCVNATNGAKLWENQLTSTGTIQSSPTVADGKVYVTTTDNYIFRCNTSDGAYGDWYYQAQDAIYSTPAVSGSMVYFGCDDGRVYALDTSNPLGFNKVWWFLTNATIRSSPCVANSQVFIGSGSTDHAILALNATTTNANGQLIWKYVLNYGTSPVSGSVAFYNNRVYFTGYSGKVYCLDANASPGKYTEDQPGCKIWSQTIGTYQAWNQGVAIAGDRVFASDGSYLVYALDINSNGAFTSWISRNPSRAFNEPIIADGRVFLTDYYSVYSVGDYYPPVTYYYTVTPPGAGGLSFDIKLVVANATPSKTINTQLLVSQKKLNFTVTGIDGTLGMLNITLPNNMLGEPYIVRVNGGIIGSAVTTPVDSTHTSIYFTYDQSINGIEITGNTAIPEFSSALVVPLLMAISLIAAIPARKKLPKN